MAACAVSELLLLFVSTFLTPIAKPMPLMQRDSEHATPLHQYELDLVVRPRELWV